jgi:hypothetical protein
MFVENCRRTRKREGAQKKEGRKEGAKERKSERAENDRPNEAKQNQRCPSAILSDEYRDARWGHEGRRKRKTFLMQF